MKPVTIPAGIARNTWRTTLRKVEAGERFILSHYGRPLVALVPLADLERLTQEAPAATATGGTDGRP